MREAFTTPPSFSASTYLLSPSATNKFLHGLQKWQMLRLEGDKIWLRVLTEYDIRYILVVEI